MKDLVLSGEAIVEGTVKGIVSENQLPGYTFKMSLNNGELNHKDLVTPLKRIRFDFNVKNDDGKDQSLDRIGAVSSSQYGD